MSAGFHPFSVFMRLRETHPEQYHTLKTQRMMRWSCKHLGDDTFFDLQEVRNHDSQ